MKLEIEITPGNWIAVEPEQLTDDHEQHPTTDDPELLGGSSWYLDGDYTTPPREIRVDEHHSEYVLVIHAE